MGTRQIEEPYYVYLGEDGRWGAASVEIWDSTDLESRPRVKFLLPPVLAHSKSDAMRKMSPREYEAFEQEADEALWALSQSNGETPGPHEY